MSVCVRVHVLVCWFLSSTLRLGLCYLLLLIPGYPTPTLLDSSCLCHHSVLQGHWEHDRHLCAWLYMGSGDANSGPNTVLCDKHFHALIYLPAGL